MVACLTLFIIFFGFTWGPVLWVMLPELFPMRARGAATGIAALVRSIGSLLVAQLFPILTDILSVEQVFLIFAAVGVCALIFVIKYLPETRGRRLEDIDADLRSRTNATDVDVKESKSARLLYNSTKMSFSDTKTTFSKQARISVWISSDCRQSLRLWWQFFWARLP